MPSALSICPIAITSESPLVKPVITGAGMKLMIRPSRKIPSASTIAAASSEASQSPRRPCCCTTRIITADIAPVGPLIW